MASRRKPPKGVQTVVLMQCARRCCLCFGIDGDRFPKDGQIAHLDDNPSNNDPDNLVWLCLDHHAKWHTRGNMTKGLTVDEVKAYRARLHDAVETGECPGENEPCTIKFPIAFHTTAGKSNTIINAAGDVHYNARVTKKNVVQPGPQHVSSEQALTIRTRIVELAELESTSGRKLNPGKWYNKLYRAFGVTSYVLVPADRYDEVITWIQQQGALLRPKLRRSNNPKWRNSLYAGIWARAEEVGLSREAVHEFAGSVLGISPPPTSLSDLQERQLKQLYDAFFRQTRNRSGSGNTSRG